MLKTKTQDEASNKVKVINSRSQKEINEQRRKVRNQRIKKMRSRVQSILDEKDDNKRML